MKENRKAYFYPRPPRGGRLTREYYYSGREQFLSTPSARRATGAYPRRGAQTSDFYPRPPRGGRHLESVMLEQTDIDFYPRPPRGGRPTKEVQSFAAAIFLSTPSARRATVAGQAHSIRAAISIHALREEGDLYGHSDQGKQGNFYPRPPRGGRLFDNVDAHCDERISIHALREEGDPKILLSCSRAIHFYPRPPRGGRPGRNNRPAAPSDISIHALREEGDPLRRSPPHPRRAISIHALREEGDSKNRDKISIFL